MSMWNMNLLQQILVVMVVALSCIQLSLGQSYPVTTIQNSGDINKRINYVYLPDGFTASEQSAFTANAMAVNDELFSQQPFSNYRNFFNAYTIAVPSNQSGVDHPATATDVNEPVFPALTVDTYFDSSFDAFNIHRLLVAFDNSFQLYPILNTNVPQYDQAILIANSVEYGGSGGSIAVSSINSSSIEVAIHELGHSFANLSDEYWAGTQYARENYNMTQETNPASVRWKEWFGEQQVGIFDHCCGSAPSSWKKPHQTCKMQFLGNPFCAVCTQRIVDRIYELVQPINDYSPSNLTVTHTGTPVVFDLDLIYPIPNTLRVEWELNGTIIQGAQSNSLSLTATGLFDGQNTLIGRVIDETQLSRTYFPDAGYEFFVTWIVNFNCPDFNSDGICDEFDPCVNNLLETNQPLITNNKQAQFTTQTNGIVAAPNAIVYTAGQSIQLNPQFEVEQGAIYVATISPCQ